MKSLIDRLRTLLILGRVSNLPTVWSNLLVGWVLGGANHSLVSVLLVLLGGSFLYVGGMYLNDFCDASFDAQYCPGRPIPAGKISRRTVGILATSWFIVGLACFAPFGVGPLAIAMLLTALIIIYDCKHKNVSWAPLVMGICRILLYPLAASIFFFQGIVTEKYAYISHGYLALSAVAMRIVTGTLPAAIPLGLYVAGITFLARGESRPGKPTRWALLLLLSPALFSFIEYARSNSSTIPLMPVLLICLLQIYWMGWLLIPFWRKTRPSIGRVVSGLLSGLVFVDMIALIPYVGPLGIALIPLFGLALLLQRVIPAT